MNDLKNYTVALIRNQIIPLDSFVAQRDSKWVLTKSFAGLTADTTFNSEQEMYDKVAT